MTSVTTERVNREIVEPAMDGRALNLHQARLLANHETPEIDSVIEHLDALHEFGVPAERIERLRRKVWLLVELNGREGQTQRTIAGNGEQLARELRPLDGPNARPSCKRPEIRRRLGPILDAVAADPDRDWTIVAETIEQRWPRTTLLSRSTLHELGTTRADALRRLLEAS